MISAYEEVDQRIEYLTFRDIPYRIKISIKYKDCISIELVDRSTSIVYLGDFAPTYVEEMTRKTGNFKKFSVFAEMLLSAIDNRPSSSPLAVSLDLLSSTDLNALRNSTMNARSLHDEDKRYLILTYATAYDRVHYPLPLESRMTSGTEPFDLGTSRIKIEDYSKLQSEFSELKAQYDESIEKLAQVMIENDKLRHQLKYVPDESKNLRKVNAELREQVDYLTNQVKREMDLIKSEAAVRYKRDQSSNKQYLESRIMKLSAELETEISKRKMQIKLKDDRIAHLERQLRISSQRPISTSGATRNNYGRTDSKTRLPSPSIKSNSGSKPKRFDPTEYVRSRQDRQKRSGSVTSMRSASVESRSSVKSKNGRDVIRKPSLSKPSAASRSSSVDSQRYQRGRSPSVFDRLYYNNAPHHKNTSEVNNNHHQRTPNRSRSRLPDNILPERSESHAIDSKLTIEDRLSNLHEMIERAKLI